MIRHQLSIFVDNEPGVLARVARALADGGVNLRAISVSDNADDAVLRLVVDDDRKAIDILERTGALVVSRDVVEVAVPDEPGALAQICSTLAAKGLNISYAYGSASGGAAGKASLFFRIAPPHTAAEADAAIAAQLGRA